MLCATKSADVQRTGFGMLSFDGGAVEETKPPGAARPFMHP
jgi:hypothetical protein